METIFNTEQYKQRLLTEEQRLVKAIGRANTSALELDGAPAGDSVDILVSGEAKEGQFQEVDMEWDRLNQVRTALKRMEVGTFGRCVVDGGPIEEKRLKAVPWTAYCLKHEQLLEREKSRPMPTL